MSQKVITFLSHRPQYQTNPVELTTTDCPNQAPQIFEFLPKGVHLQLTILN